MFGSLGMPELIVIFVIALIVFSEFKKATNELQSSLEEEIRLEEKRAAPPSAASSAPLGEAVPAPKAG